MNYNTKYVVRLSDEERTQLSELVNRGKIAAAKRRRAHILLKVDAGVDGSGPGSFEFQYEFCQDLIVRAVIRRVAHSISKSP